MPRKGIPYLERRPGTYPNRSVSRRIFPAAQHPAFPGSAPPAPLTGQGTVLLFFRFRESEACLDVGHRQWDSGGHGHGESR